MRVAVISDIHGNFWALEAVLEALKHDAPDLIVQAGDLALNGPRPGDVVDLIREQRISGVVGNTVELLWKPEVRAEQEARMPTLRRLLYILFDESAVATRELLGVDRLEWMKSLPAKLGLENLAVVHASPGDLWNAPMPHADDQSLAEVYKPLGAPVVVYGHVHRPFVRQLHELVVANSGSVGMPYDGDPRASYLLIEDGLVSVRRVEYDVDQEVADLVTTDYPYAHWFAEMRRRGIFVSPPTNSDQ
jgi:predicted phosphodiesterase